MMQFFVQIAVKQTLTLLGEKMDTSKDIVKHLFYATWAMVLIQSIITISSILLGSVYLNLSLILSVTFDCVIILFSIGIIRAGRENRGFKRWFSSSLVFLISAGSDIVVVILFYIIGREEIWGTSPVIFVRLALRIIFYVTLVAAFTLNKFFFDDLLDKNDINRKSDFLAPIGFLILFIPSVLSWYSEYVYPQSLPDWLLFMVLALILLAQFVILLGLFRLTSNLNLLRLKGVQRQEEIFEAEKEEGKTMVEDNNKEEMHQ